MISIIIPTHNEEKRLPSTIKEIRRLLKIKYEIIVVDDGNDSTQKIARKLGCRSFHFKTRIGKGAALNYGIKKAKGSIVVTYDADAAAPPTEILKLVEKTHEADVVISTRYGKTKVKRSNERLIASKTFRGIVRILFNLKYSDTQCGLKAMKAPNAKKLAKQSKVSGFVWDVELLINAKKNGYVIKEVPVEWIEKGGGPLGANVLKNANRMLKELIDLYLRQS